MGVEIVGVDEAHGIGGHHRRAGQRGQVDEVVDNLCVVGPAQAFEFEEEIAVKNCLPMLDAGDGLLGMAGPHGAGHAAVEAARQRDQAICMRSNPIRLQHRHAAHLAIYVAARQQAHEVDIASMVATQQPQSRGRLVAALVHPEIGPQNRFDAGFERRGVVLDGGELIALVGHRHCGLAARCAGLDQLGQAHHAVNQGVFRMHRQVHEAGCLLIGLLSGVVSHWDGGFDGTS